MSFFKEWFKSDLEKNNEVINKCDKVYTECKKDFEKYDTKEKFEKAIKDNMNG